MAGQQLLVLARSYCESESGRGTVALSRELLRVRAEALQLPTPTPRTARAGDPMDELSRRRRDPKRGQRSKRGYGGNPNPDKW
jgi:hypothetical protein